MSEDRIRPPAHVAPWVEVLGESAAVEAFLALGGSLVDLAFDPRSSRLSEAIGLDRAAALGRSFGRGKVKVPIPKIWIAQVLWHNGTAQQEIARRLHVDVSSVRRWLKAMPGGRRRKPDDRQIELF